ncbi:MAG TPA: redoxin domain-containing protein [Acidimicrobiia bacterium]|nr:redoxin domain-containing protein [Acidimicrobiia bacterium]
MVAVGEAAPDFVLRDQTRAKRSLAELFGSRSMVIFMPFAFTNTCLGEMCTLRDNLHYLESSGTRFFVITTDTLHSNRRWAEDQGFEFPILSDFWPHGAVAQAYGCFNPAIGVAMRSTYVLDEAGVVREIIATDRLDVPRDFGEYERALGSTFEA